ncbi:hypothetical protein BH09MYX1_BH09MYX1_14230 [soil metagenome]
MTLAIALSYWVPALRVTGGDFPAPLDDVYIHFDFARAAARGSPFAWIAGQGYSSGETAPAYALVLAIGWAVGFRDMRLGWFAAAVAVVALVLALRSLSRIFARSSFALRASAAVLLLACGHVAFGVFSGMELALHVFFVLRAVEARTVIEGASASARPAREWQLGLWGALLVWTRPESVVIIAPLAVAAARARSTRWPWASLARTLAPAFFATAAIAGLNRVLTGEMQSAGALLKLLSSNPFLSDVDRARELVVNLLDFGWKVLEGSLVATPALLFALVVVCAFGVLDRGLRDRTGALLGAAVLYALLVSWNGAARYQNFRYYVPSVVLFLLAVVHGAEAIERRWRTGKARMLSPAAVAAAALSALSRSGSQRAFYRRAAANIHGQQVEVGIRLRTKMGPNDRVLVGDAGAIPYLTDRSAIDALGLGGFSRMPFARAATTGEAATVELIQRLPPAKRPTFLALYPNWFGGITSAFGHEIERVTIEDNVICGGPTKIIYRADFSALDRDVAPAGVLDEIDVADPISEAGHHYVSAAPRGGFSVLAVRAGTNGDAFDGGRIMPPETEESFDVSANEDAVIVVRSDSAIDAIVVSRGRDPVALRASAAADGRWIEARAALAATSRITLRAKTVALRDFHVWIVKP